MAAGKIRIPETRPDAVPRMRLLEQLSEDLFHEGSFTRRLSLISAPAGFGKTTLAAMWVRHCSRINPRLCVAWLSLDEGDREAASFMNHLRAALGSALPAFAAATGIPRPGPAADGELSMTTLLNELADIEETVLLVLDDYHFAAGDEVDRALALLIDHLPPRMHVTIATRMDPALPLPRFRARGQVTELRAEDLRFVPPEAAEFLRRTMRLNISEEGLKALELRTEGWIAGLQLAALSLRGRSDAEAFIKSFTGSHRFVLDYLVEEVLRREQKEVGDFLLRTSILDQYCLPLCDAVLGKNSRAALEKIERANLFLVALDDRREWYRYHHLFADVLRSRLAVELPLEIAGLHSRASAWYETAGFPEEAIRHALSGKDYETAARLIELRWPAMDGDFRAAAWLEWVGQLPDAAVRARPVLSAGYGWALLDTGNFEASEVRFLDAENPPEGFLVADDDQYRAMPSSIAVARAYRALALGAVSEALDQANRALALAPEGDKKWRSAAGALVGIASYAEGNLPKAEEALCSAMSFSRGAGKLSESESMTFLLADIRIALGRLRDAERTYEDSSRLVAAREKELPLVAAELHRGIGEVLLERGKLEASGEEFRIGRAMGEEASMTDWRYRVSAAEARLAELGGDLDAALELLDEAERFHVRTPLPDLRPVDALRARIWVRLGDPEKALAWARERGLSVDGGFGFLDEFGCGTLARALIARFDKNRDKADLDSAAGLLKRLLDAAEAGERRGNAIEILALLALALEARGDHALALAHLGRAVAMAEGEGYALAFMGEGPRMAGLLRRLQAATATPALKAYIGMLLAAGADAAGAAGARDAGTSPLREPLSERELQVLRLLRSDLSGPELARELYISLNTLRTHTKNIFDKLAVNSRRAAVRRAEALGLA